MTPPALPLDILVNVLHWLPPSRALISPSVRTLLSCSIASSLLREAASLAAIWEPHYRARYRHCQKEKEEQRRSSVNNNWRDLYLIRQHLDNEALGLVRTMIYEVHSRTDATQQLLDFGMDAWDVLSLSHERKSVSRILESDDPLEFGPEPLTWTYWVEAMARGLTKQDAIRAWSSMLASGADAQGERPNFEEAQCYTSSFFGVPQLDIMETLSSLSERCKDFLGSRGRVLDPESASYDLPSLCREIYLYMQSEGMTLASGLQYQQLMNKFPHTYLSTHKPTIPLSLAHTFCSIAKRVGIRALPINFPGRVLIEVSHPKKDIDPPLILNPSASQENRFVLNERSDWVTDSEFPFPVFPGPHDGMFTPSHGVGPMLTRTSYNILNAMRDGTSTVMQKSASVLCSMCIGLLTSDDAMIIQSLFAMLDLSPLDSHILYKTLLPSIKGDALQYQLLRERCSDAFRQEQLDTLDLKRRVEGQSPEFFVGMGIRHAKFDYQGVIYGWDATCKQSEQWMQQMGVDNLSKGRNQPFYHVFVASEVVPSSPRYVAEENIIPIEVDEALVTALFSRIDGAGKQFGHVVFNREGEGQSFSGRFLQSPESRNVYPDDEAYAVGWAQRRYEARASDTAID
ncbi:hypothetical protein BKA70DRAFT_1382030 [Coprinopsis sp. MPI-PUGE-AT-0042]|nr:hypothetical protein BKA70DRAFT_1382030 [Coprinopsis sp. MPI-PUGE-AT-0042]